MLNLTTASKGTDFQTCGFYFFHVILYIFGANTKRLITQSYFPTQFAQYF